MTKKTLGELLFPHIDKDISYYENLYPKRNLKEEAIVTRYAPSPTGSVHMGALFAAFINRKMAKQTGGIFYLRIEDTDKKREVEGGVLEIINDLKNFGITSDEGITVTGQSVGDYGPYIQSERKEIYETFAKHLLDKGLAYPCFCTEEELEEIRTKQEELKTRIGYYGSWARDRNLTYDEIVERINAGENYIIRLKSPGNFENKKTYNDLVKGEIDYPENDLDVIIIKSDGLPTYHFAHVVDDYLMRTTHVIRGDEWVSSLPIHLQLYEVLDLTPPKYAHIAPLLKDDNGTRRKLSKRKDPEAAVSYYHELGVPEEAVVLYLATIANSNFEEWYEQNPDKNIDDFTMEFNKISSSGSLFDVEKLMNISKNYISKLTAEDVFNKTLEYAEKYDDELKGLLLKYPDYSKAIFNIERNIEKPRKDYACFGDIKNQIWYMYDELFEKSDKTSYEFKNINDKEEIKLLCDYYYEKYYDINDTKEIWFSKMKLLAHDFGYASEVKDYKKNPENYKGHIGDVSMVLRVILTTKSQTPDLYEIMKLLGKERMLKRVKKYLEE